MEEGNLKEDAAGSRSKALVLKTRILEALERLGEGLDEREPEAILIKKLKAECEKETREVYLYHQLKTLNEIITEQQKMGSWY